MIDFILIKYDTKYVNKFVYMFNHYFGTNVQ